MDGPMATPDDIKEVSSALLGFAELQAGELPTDPGVAGVLRLLGQDALMSFR